MIIINKKNYYIFWVNLWTRFKCKQGEKLVKDKWFPQYSLIKRFLVMLKINNCSTVYPPKWLLVHNCSILGNELLRNSCKIENTSKLAYVLNCMFMSRNVINFFWVVESCFSMSLQTVHCSILHLTSMQILLEIIC